MLFDHKKGGNLTTCNNIDGLWGHYVKWSTSDRKRQTLYELKKKKNWTYRKRTDWWLPELATRGNRWTGSKAKNRKKGFTSSNNDPGLASPPLSLPFTLNPRLWLPPLSLPFTPNTIPLASTHINSPSPLIPCLWKILTWFMPQGKIPLFYNRHFSGV